MAKAYAKRVKQTPSDKGVEKARKCLKSNRLVAVPYDKGVDFCALIVHFCMTSSSYYNLNKILAKLFAQIEGANIVTNSLDTREILESISLEPNENLITLALKSLYTNVPLKEAIDIALRKLNEQDEPASIARKTIKRLLNKAVSQVHFKSNETWYVQKDGLAMGASLAVNLANLWLKQYETAISRDIPEMFLPKKHLDGICPECHRKDTYRSKGVESEFRLNWYHVKCGDISYDEYQNMSETIWYCKKCKRAANLLHRNLQFTIETPNTNGKLEFLYLQISLDKNRKIDCGWC